MNAPISAELRAALQSVTLDDKYTLTSGRAYMSGTQALIRLLMLQRQRDAAAGLNTAGFLTGYRGSPLGSVDQTAWKAKKYLKENHIHFQPGLNEDLAATSVWGTQQVNMYKGAKYDGVFGMWYGKGPGVDRCGDVFKHANAAGTSPNGGVLVVCGDDHSAKSSTLPHQSDHILKACMIPVLYPASVQDYLDMGIHGYAMSRYAGVWVGLKVVTDVVEASASVIVDPQRTNIVLPSDFNLPEGGLNIRWPDTPLQQEARLLDHKAYATLAYARANKLNHTVIDSPNARLGIVSSGKAYLDTRQALEDLGLDERTCAAIGLRLYKCGMVWPLESQGIQEFARGLQEILVVEEKRQMLEYQIKEELYNVPDGQRPRVIGKFDEKGEWAMPHGQWLLPAHYEFSPAMVAKAIASRILNGAVKFDLSSDVKSRIAARLAIIEAKEKALAKPRVQVERKPYFCSGCPHNTSTRVPEGSRAVAGIGCHYMVVWMDRGTETFTQMGGEGTPWIGQAPFTDEKHIFANLGDGTYFHSGLLAIRASIAAGVNITYKILYNDAVAMTGGQPIDGHISVPMIAQQVHAEGTKKIVIVTDEPEKYASGRHTAYSGEDGLLPAGIEIFHRDQLDDVQKNLRDTAGCTVLIYDQTCASEKRRRRKKIVDGKPGFPDPARRTVINEAVCEGCGDCSVQSNCLSVEPLETEYGRKRQINQSTCNKDFSCLKGFCPSFVTVEGGKLKKGKGSSEASVPALPEPAIPSLESGNYGVLITGVGGTGVVTVGQLLGMAAHLEGKGLSALDMAGLAQKGGAVMSHVQIAKTPEHLFATRIAMGDADLVLGCDSITTATNEALSKVRAGVTRVVLNSAESPTADFVTNRNWQFPGASNQQDVLDALGGAAHAANLSVVDASSLATQLMGDSIFSNPFVLGYAWQKGWVPLTEAALLRAIELNGVQIEANKKAFGWGRFAAHDLEAVKRIASPQANVVEIKRITKGLDELIADRTKFLTEYQDAKYAQRYTALVDKVRRAEEKLSAGTKLSESVARYFFKLMAYKDEYEVARLYTQTGFAEKIAAQFEGDYKLNFYLAPPLLAKKDAQGRLIKKQYGPWIMTAFKLLAKCKGLRGTALDVFGKTEERRTERALIGEYEQMIDTLLPKLSTDNLAVAVQLASIPDDIRGYGHVKEASLVKAREKQAQLLQQLSAKVIEIKRAAA
ncbi:MAG: indolepyruvate ferredoxin oxidoreductase family protein [Burkholderiaceae bacterium]